MSRPVTSPQASAAPGGSSASAPRLPSLTGLRFPCALAVLLLHIWLLIGFLGDEPPTEAGPAAVPFVLVGALAPIGVSCFFVLSGFVLTWTASPDDSARGFWWRRAVKVYPSHAAVWAGMLIILWLTGVAPDAEQQQESPSWGPALANLFLVHSWSPDKEYMAGVNGVTWSLTVEVFCYALFPVLLPLIRRIRRGHLMTAAGAVIGAVWLMPVIALQLGGPETPLFGMRHYQFWFGYMFPVARLPEFILGMVLARIAREERRSPLGMTASAVLLIVSLGVGLFLLPLPFATGAVTVVPVALLLLAAASADLRAARSWLRSPVAVFLGTISFALYLVHWPVILLLDHLLLGDGSCGFLQAMGVTALFGAVSVLLAWLLYRAVEAPMMRRFASRPHAPSPALPPRHDSARRCPMTVPGSPAPSPPPPSQSSQSSSRPPTRSSPPAPPARLSSLLAFVRLGRPKFLFQSMMVVGLGVTAALHEGFDFSFQWYVIALLFAWTSHLMTHYCNEYFDLEADRANHVPTSWTGGSRILVNGVLPPVVSLGTAFLLLFVAVFLTSAMPDVTSRMLAAVIIAAAWFYTAPPLRLNYRALGEAACAAVLYGMGPLLVFRLQTGSISAAVCGYVAVVFLLQFLRMSVMNLADIEGDRRVGKRTLAVVLGRQGLIRLFVVGQAVVYAVIGLLLALAAVPLLPGLCMLATVVVPVWVGRQLLGGRISDPSRANAVTFWSSMHLPITAVAITVGLLADMVREETTPGGLWLGICGTTLAIFTAWFLRAVPRPAGRAKARQRPA